MSTSDPFGVPLELRGLLNQVSAGSNTPPLGTSPGPGALAGSSPGVALSAAQPIASPTLPDPMDTSAMTLLITRMANELFAVPPGTPMSSPQQLASGALASEPPSAGLSAEAPLSAAPATAAMPSPVAASQPAMAAPPQSPPMSTTLPQSTPTAPPMSTTLPQPTPSTQSTPPTSPPMSTTLPQSTPPTSPPASPTPPISSLPQSTPPAPPAPSQQQLSPGLAGLPREAPDALAASQAANPFGPTSLDNFDPGGGFTEVLLMPMLAELAQDSAPLFLPRAGAPTLDEAPRFELVSAHELVQPAVRDLGGTAFDPHAVRRDFPILEEIVHGKRLIWLDNAATTQKPRAVIDRLTAFYEHENSNIHRAAHTLAARATDAYETAREITRRFLNAPSDEDIIFVRGATEGINLIAQSWGRRNIQSGDEIVLTHLEHHANIVPWQQLCAETGARLRVAPVDDRGDIILEEYDRLLNPRTRLVAFPQVSNALGTITPAREMVELAHRRGAVVLVDGAQAVSHLRVDVQALDCDFYVFSGHKVFAPTGIGVVYGKRDVLAGMPPWQGGGNMIQDVTFEHTTYQPPPMRFEAGTGNIADAAGLGAALDYVMRIGMDVIDRYEHELLVYATERLEAVPGLRMVGTSPNKAGVLSFILDGHRNEDVGAALDRDGIAVRSGHHCAQPILRRFGLEGTVRASLALYNVPEDIDSLVATLLRIVGER